MSKKSTVWIGIMANDCLSTFETNTDVLTHWFKHGETDNHEFDTLMYDATYKDVDGVINIIEGKNQVDSSVGEDGSLVVMSTIGYHSMIANVAMIMLNIRIGGDAEDISEMEKVKIPKD